MDTDDYTSEKASRELIEEYSKYIIYSKILFIINLGIISCLIYFLLHTLSDLQSLHFDTSRYFIPTAESFFWLSALFFGVLFAYIPNLFLFKAILGNKRYSEFYLALEYSMENNNSYNKWFADKGSTFIKFFYTSAYVLTLLFSFFSMNSYARVTYDAFYVNRFFDLKETEYRFDGIKYVLLTKSFRAPNGSIVRDWYFSIGFDDGSEYNFHKAAHNLTYKQELVVAKHVSYLSGVKLTVSDPFPEEKSE